MVDTAVDFSLLRFGIREFCFQYTFAYINRYCKVLWATANHLALARSAVSVSTRLPLRTATEDSMAHLHDSTRQRSHPIHFIAFL